MDHKQTDDLLTELETADPADAADLAVEAARLLGDELDRPASESAPETVAESGQSAHETEDPA